MPITQFEVRPGAYYDSVILMQLQRDLAELEGVVDAAVVMATPANCDLLDQGGLLPQKAGGAGPDDLLIVVKADHEDAATQALSKVDELLSRRRSAAPGQYQPRSLQSAVRSLPAANLVMISVPGRYAASVTRDALDLGKHVFLYSDNVSLEDEIELKRAAQSQSLLVMGPDCGTAIINGVGLGFANRVRRGRIGLVGASGTGLQTVTVLLHSFGSGVSQAIGTGGRDLHAEVGAITSQQGLSLLAQDPETRVIVLVSKPPAAGVVSRLLGAARQTGKPVVVAFTGYPPPGRRVGNLHFAASLSEAASLAIELEQGRMQEETSSMAGEAPAQPGSGFLRGLFSGGTLAYETLVGLRPFLQPLYSNLALPGVNRLEDPTASIADTILDLGEDVFTVGRLHPMMDNDLRMRRMRQEAEDPEVTLMLLDVILGEGAHPDPAADIAPEIAAIKEKRSLEVVCLVIGTDEDPQNIESQVERLRSAGAVVFMNLGDALDYVLDRTVSSEAALTSAVPASLLSRQMSVVNVGLISFYESMAAQGVETIHVDWRPPASGDERLMSILERMKGTKAL